MPAGRPSKYDPAFCDAVVEWGKQGKSRVWMCSEMDISVPTMATWEKEHPEFLAATTRARLHSQRWWEDAGQSGIMMPGFNSSVWARNMGARFDGWADKTETKNTSNVTVVSKYEMSDDELAAIAAGGGTRASSS